MTDFTIEIHFKEHENTKNQNLNLNKAPNSPNPEFLLILDAIFEIVFLPFTPQSRVREPNGGLVPKSFLRNYLSLTHRGYPQDVLQVDGNTPNRALPLATLG